MRTLKLLGSYFCAARPFLFAQRRFIIEGMNAITLALYVGFALFTAFPYKNVIVATGGTLAVRALIAILLYAISCGISYYVIRKHLGRSGPREFVKKAILVILDLCMLLTLGFVSFSIQRIIIPPAQFTQTFGYLATIFGSSNYFFWWFIAPLVALLFI